MILKSALLFGIIAAFLVVGSVSAHDHSNAGHGQGQRSQEQDGGEFEIGGADQVSRDPLVGRRWGGDNAQHDRNQRHLRPMWFEIEESQSSQEKDGGEIPVRQISSRLLKAPGVTLRWGPGNAHFRNQRHLRPMWRILKDPLGAMRWGANIQNFHFQYRNRRHLRPM